jgi:phosphate transport system substrate-binding protein
MITNAGGAEAYPICGFTWLLVHRAYSNAENGKAIKDFLSWYLTDGEGMAADLYYAPLPESIISKVQAKIDMIK